MGLWETKKTFDRLNDLLSQIERAYVKFNSARDTLIAFTRPDLGSDVDPDGDGTFFGEDIYDGIGVWAPRVMAKGFQGGLVSADADWFAHKMGASELEDIDRLDLWLQWVDRHLLDVYQKSNFYRVLPGITLDGITIGSPVVIIEETDVVDGIITFKPQHYKTVFLFYNQDNVAEGLILKDETWTVKQISDRFAKSESEQKEKLSLSLNNLIQNGNFYKQNTIIRGIFPGDHPVWGSDGFNKPNAEWISVFFECKTKEERKDEPLQVETYFSRPFVPWDYDKKPWESVSRTPAFEAIYDIRGQQQMTKEKLENLKLVNRPAMAVLEDHRNIVDFRPEGITPIAKADWGNLPAAIQNVGNIQLSRDELEIGAAKVNRWFATEEFRKFTDLTDNLRQQPSATQVIKIAAEIATQVNPGIATYTTGFLKDVDARIIDIEFRARRGPFSLEAMAEISEIVIGILGERANEATPIPVFTGQLARAQKLKAELDPILDGLGVARELFEVYPDLKNAIREYGTLEDVLKAVGFPLKDLKPEDEYNEIIAQLTEARTRMEQQQFALEAAKASKNLQGPVDESSVLATVGGGG